jgi:hypothetical protein
LDSGTAALTLNGTEQALSAYLASAGKLTYNGTEGTRTLTVRVQPPVGAPIAGQVQAETVKTAVVTAQTPVAVTEGNSGTAATAPANSRLHAVMARRDQRTVEYRGRLSKVRRSLRSSVDDACRLVELGGVLAKSAKIEAAYGAGFSASLAQVSGEFDGIVEEIRVSLDTLRRSNFFKG